MDTPAHQLGPNPTAWVGLTAYLLPDGGVSHYELITGDFDGALLSSSALACVEPTPTDPRAVRIVSEWSRALLAAWEMGERERAGRHEA